MQTDLAQRRDDVSAELAALEARQGASLLDGEEFDGSMIAVKRRELEAIDAAEAEAVRRDRAAAAEAQARTRAAARSEARQELAGYADAVKRAEAAAKALTDALSDINGHCAALSALLRRMDITPPLAIGGHSVRNDHSRLLAHDLKRLGSVSQYGCIKWWGAYPPDDWQGHARKVAAAIEPLIGE